MLRKKVIYFLTICSIIITVITGNNFLILISGFLFVLSCSSLYHSISMKEQVELEHKFKTINDKVQNVENFNSTESYNALNCVISIDENSEQLVIADTVHTYVFKFTDIIESEIIQDKITINRTSRSGQLVGSLVGGAIGGGIGAVVGGLSGKQESNTNVKSIVLNIVANDLQAPFHKINFLDSQTPINLEDPLFIAAINGANRWHGIMSVIVNRSKQSVM